VSHDKKALQVERTVSRSIQFGKVLLTGATGLLGPYLTAAFNDIGRVSTLARSKADFNIDLLDSEAVCNLIADFKPDLVVHAAALTNVDYCEIHPNEAYALNSGTTRVIAAALNSSSRLIYFSTDQVYPGSSGPHREEGCDPVNVYGKSKLEGESEALRHPGTIVLRTNIFGPSLSISRRSLSDFVIESLSEHRQVEFFSDILFSPLHLKSMAQFVVRSVQAGLTGIYNLGSRDGMSKKDFAHAIATHLGLSLNNARTVSFRQHAFLAPRPADMRMNVTRLENILGERMPSLADEIIKL
jgi:dTDP-4-dehydrorhamnose reductase